jgi:hypothetical protein
VRWLDEFLGLSVMETFPSNKRLVMKALKNGLRYQSIERLDGARAETKGSIHCKWSMSC